MIVNIVYTEPLRIKSSIINSNIQFINENTYIDVNYPRFKNEEIDKIISNYIYDYVRKFKLIDETKTLKIDYDIYYKDNSILPPGSLEHSSYESYFKWGLPKMPPTKIASTTFLKCLDELNNINLVDTGEGERKALEIKKGLKVGCGCLTIVTMVAILAAMGVFDGEQLGFMETTLVIISMIALFALGAYITKDT